MPWCEPCAKYHAPSSMTPEGGCPDCGMQMTVADVHGKVTAQNIDLKQLAGVEADESLPWHFKLLVFLLGVYLTWRVIQIFV